MWLILEAEYLSGWLEFTEGPSVEFVAVPQGTSTTKTLAGVSAGASDDDGDLAAARPLAGTSTGQSNTSGSFTASSLAGRSTGTSSDVGAVVVRAALAGVSIGDSETTGSLLGAVAPADEVQDVADRLYRRLLPLHDPVAAESPPDDALYGVCRAVCADLQPYERIIRSYDGMAPWGRAGDVTSAPLWVLPWMASLVGVEWHGDPTETLRTQIRALPRFRRGTTQAITDATRSTLTGTQEVRITPRSGGSIWQLLIVTKNDETPDPGSTVRAIKAQKPAGMILTHILSDVPVIDEANAALTIDSVSSTVTIDNVTLGDVD